MTENVDPDDPRPEGHYHIARDAEWHYVNDDLAETISLGPATDGEPGDGAIVYANRAFQQMTGYAEEELLGRTPELFRGPDTDPDVIARKLAPNRRVICAAPSYVERWGAPETPADLARHNCLGLTTVAAWNDWAFDEPNAETMRISGNFEANSADAIYHAALAGVGIARLSTYLVQDDLRAGRLVRLLPHYIQDNANIVAIYAERRNLAPKIRAFLDFLVNYFGSVPPWERGGEAD